VISRFGAIRVLAVGSVFASVGIAFSLCSSSWLLALLGYAMVGAGCANIVPVLFTAVARQTDMPQASAVPAMTTLGYAGVLIGPAFIGFVAHASSLIVALAFVAVALLIVAAFSRSIRV
jgi:MFS family permease